MKRYFILFSSLFIFSIFAPTPLMSAPKKTTSSKKYIDIDKNEPTKKTQHSAKSTSSSTQAALKKHAATGSSDMVMIINPEMRAKDIKDVLTFLNKTSGNKPVSIDLTDGRVITNIMSIDVMPAGTMLVLKSSSVKGVQYHVVGIESVENIGHN